MRRSPRSAVAPPPTSRKLAGSPPYSLMYPWSPWPSRRIDHTADGTIELDVVQLVTMGFELRRVSSLSSRSSSTSDGGTGRWSRSSSWRREPERRRLLVTTSGVDLNHRGIEVTERPVQCRSGNRTAFLTLIALEAEAVGDAAGMIAAQTGSADRSAP